VIGSQYDVRIECLEQRFKIAAADSSEKRVHDSSLPLKINIGNWGGSLHSAARATGELPCRNLRAPRDGSNLLERDCEHVVQHKGEPLMGIQSFQYDKEREADRVSYQRTAFGIDLFFAA